MREMRSADFFFFFFYFFVYKLVGLSILQRVWEEKSTLKSWNCTQVVSDVSSYKKKKKNNPMNIQWLARLWNYKASPGKSSCFFFFCFFFLCARLFFSWKPHWSMQLCQILNILVKQFSLHQCVVIVMCSVSMFSVDQQPCVILASYQTAGIFFSLITMKIFFSWNGFQVTPICRG